ncbi:MAG: hypothetical protein L0216_14820 [Planctomycetales bacterium]|nr:hypothetical protein [Planctomycetales bacterium]
MTGRLALAALLALAAMALGAGLFPGCSTAPPVEEGDGGDEGSEEADPEEAEGPPAGSGPAPTPRTTPTPAPEPARDPETLVLAVGCPRGAAAGFPEAEGADAAARALAGWIRGRGFRDRRSRELTETEATRAKVLAAISGDLAPGRRTDDLVVFAFSGSAARVGRGDVALLTHDADPKRAAETGIPLADLARALGAIPRADLLVILDVALGGVPGERWAGDSPPPSERGALLEALRALAARPHTAVLVACEPGEGAGGGERGLGLFPERLLEAAEKTPDPEDDGWHELADVFRAVADSVQSRSFLEGRSQTPLLFLGKASEGFVVPRSYAGR